MNSKVVTRIAPSPTGKFLHLGNLRTLLFNYLYAKNQGGKFLVRLEDTDRDRYTPEFLDHFKETLDWLGIQPDASYWNPDPNVGSFIQSERDYSDHVKFLLDNGFAYYAFDTKEDLDALRSKGLKYDASTRLSMNNSLTNPSTDVMIQSGVPYVIRFKVDPNIDISFTYEILGDITINSDQLDDKVLLKSNGIGSYHLCNVCDDHNMGVTHVMRGNEWVNSTPLHILIYQAFGWDVPKFCHLPLIMNPDGKGKLAKRTANRYGIPISPIGYYDSDDNYNKGWRDLGYDPDSFMNALSLIGWSPGDDKEIMSMDEMIKLFSLDGIGKSGARFDMDKAKWINSEHLKLTDTKDLIPFVDLKDDRFSDDNVLEIVDLAKFRSDFKHEMQSIVDLFYDDVDLKSLDTNSFNKIDDFLKWVSDSQSGFIVNCSEIDFSDKDNIKQFIYDSCQKVGVKMGKVMPGLRLAFVGGVAGPDLITTLSILGKSESRKRVANLMMFVLEKQVEMIKND